MAAAFLVLDFAGLAPSLIETRHFSASSLSLT
jgi:hypothetical protein